ncbi:MAG: GNAT family N-acetyltransferase [Proteobacteria bacterium]|nr:GNAT family N-acetyltransferase [Pseudomonadota bacterium]
MVKVEIYKRDNLPEIIDEIGIIRLNEFKKYPDLYVSTLERQHMYFNNLLNDPRSIITVFRDNEKIIGFCISTPLTCYKYIPNLKEELEKKDININECYCCTDVIILEGYRKKGLARKAFDIQEKHASENGFKKVVLFNTVDDIHHPLRPHNYVTNNVFFEQLRFKSLGLVLSMNYLTLQPDNSTKKEDHLLNFWEKEVLQ